MSSPSERPLLAYFGHHKCASTFFEHVIGEICTELDLRAATFAKPQTFNSDLRSFVRRNRIDFIIYRLADFRYIQELDNYLGFHVIRDPRDICVSAYYSHLYSHPVAGMPELQNLRTALQTVPKSEGMQLEIRSRARQFRCMLEWDYSTDCIREMKFENFVQDPYRELLSAFEFLGLLDSDSYRIRNRVAGIVRSLNRRIFMRSGRRVPRLLRLNKLPAERLLGLVWENSFEQKSGGRKRGEEDVGSHYRKGQPGDWKNHFSAEHIIEFKDLYNHVLISMGYETETDWWRSHLSNLEPTMVQAH